MSVSLESARQTIFSQDGIPPAVKRTAWLLFRHELTRTNPDTDRLYTPKRALKNVLGWMEEQKMNLEMSRLSPRELKIVGMVVKGLTQKQIALELKCSRGTVKEHLQRARRKIGANSIYQVVAVAVEYGWVSAPRVDK